MPAFFVLIRCLRAATLGQTSIRTPDFKSVFSNLSIMFKGKTILNGPLLGNSQSESSVLQCLVNSREGTDTIICNPVKIVYPVWTHLWTQGRLLILSLVCNFTCMSISPLICFLGNW